MNDSSTDTPPSEETDGGANEGMKIERWADRLADRSFLAFFLIGCLLAALLPLKVVGVLSGVIDKAIEFLALAMIFPAMLFPLWITRTRWTTVGRSISAVFSTIADRAGSLILKLAGPALLCIVLACAGVAAPVMFTIAWLLGFSIGILLAVKMLANARQADLAARQDHERPQRFSFHPGIPGHRKWKPNVYDENAYAILGVAQDATAEELRAAFKGLVQKYHPHSVAPEEKERATLVFLRIDQAYELLSNWANRARYDAWIEHLDGAEPTLDEACELFRDPIRCARFDAAYKCQASEIEDDEEVTSGRQDYPPPLPASVPYDDQPRSDEEGKKESVAPVEVDIPESVREALGLPPKGRSEDS